MGLSNAERMRNYRQRLKEESAKYVGYLDKERQRYKRRKEKGEIKSIEECTDREKNKKRRQWRIQKRQNRQKHKESEKMIEKSSVVITPPNSPQGVIVEDQRRQVGRRKVRRDRAKAYKEINKLREQLKLKSREADKFRKRYERLKNQHSSEESPRKYLGKQLKHTRLQNRVRKELLFNCVLAQEIRKKMSMLRKEKEKQVVSKMVTLSVLKKYNLSHFAEKIGISSKRLRANQKRGADLGYNRKEQRNRIGIQVRGQVCEFLEEDINSKLLPGKKDVVTKKGLMKQKRILTDSLKSLHKKFVNEHPLSFISYSSFCKLKPFWVVRPSCSDRETCGCKIHLNTSYMINRLVEQKILDSTSISKACMQVVCDIESQKCMYNECDSCKEKKLSPETIESNKQVWVYSWQNKIEDRDIDKPGGLKSTLHVRISVKEKIVSTLHQLVDTFSEFLKKKVCRHVYNITHQYQQIKSLKENISDSECLIHIDFSENYSCKYETESQSVHFGASRSQVSLHTGVLYLKNKSPISFCSVSGNTRHDPSAIWAHLHPVLCKLKAQNPEVTTVHFLSDGPTTQYRSRKHFFLLKEKMHGTYGFPKVTWNFSESGHGKGAPDGVGGVIKRQADQIVAHGSDLANANDFFSCIADLGLNVELFKIPEDEIAKNDSQVPSDIKLVPGTMSIHQVVSCSLDSFISTRILSCFCSSQAIYHCFHPKNTVLHPRHERVNAVTEGCVPGVDQAEHVDGSNIQPFKLQPLSRDSLDESLVGKWVVVKYDNHPYPGIIVDVDNDSIQVKVLHKIGENRFFWPLVLDDIWYEVPENVVTLIPELLPVTKRHLQIRPDIWLIIHAELNLD